jgi:alkylation response protein AidB-like acyl-CoA dehydrogenase
MSSAATLSIHLICPHAILKYGTEEQKQKYLPRLTKGGELGAFALTEPNAGSDAAGVKTVAVYDEATNEYVLNGTKCFITGGARAGVLVIFASTDPSKGTRGITAFIVEKGTPGFSSGKIENKMGIAGSETAELIFEDCRVPAANVLGKVNQGFKIAMQALDGARISIGAIASGLAQHAMKLAKEYAHQRVTFGKPISKHQDVAFKFADMAAKIHAIDLMVWDTSAMKVEGVRHTKEAAMLKLMSSKWCKEICDGCIQMLGGNGYSAEFHVERLYRDAKVLEIAEGASGILRMLISNNVLAE